MQLWYSFRGRPVLEANEPGLRPQREKTLRLSLNQMESGVGEIPSLDGLRAMSVAVVLLAHTVSTTIFPGGFGVLTFFVISGFLITRLLFAENKRNGNVSLKNFYIRRFFRLYPVIVFYTILIVLVYGYIYSWNIDYFPPTATLLYFENYLSVYYGLHNITTNIPFGIFWSLSIEEQFYLVFPAVFILLRGHPRSVLGFSLFVCLIALILRLVVAARYPALIYTGYFYASTEYRMDSIGFGVLLASLCELDVGRSFLKKILSVQYFYAGLALILLCFVYRDPFFRETIRYTLLGIGIIICLNFILFGAALRSAQYFLNLPLISWIGKLSYSLYVWHILASKLAHVWVGESAPKLLFAPVALALSLVFAILSYYLLEKPLMKLRHRFGSKRPDDEHLFGARETTLPVSDAQPLRGE